MKDKILKVLFEYQCDQDDGSLNDWYAPLVCYMHLTDGLSMTKKEIKPTVLELRNEGLIYLSHGSDEESNLVFGTGWVLTDKGVEYCRKFITPNK